MINRHTFKQAGLTTHRKFCVVRGMEINKQK
jgi:hypothetical protein